MSKSSTIIEGDQPLFDSTSKSFMDEEKIQDSIKQYKRFNIPPDLTICQLHRQASSFGSNTMANDIRCPCCSEKIKDTLSFKDYLPDIYRINQPVGYYFTVLKMTMLALLFVTVFPGIYSLVQISSHCEDYNCDYIYGIPFPKLSAFYTDVTFFLNIGVVVVMYIIIGFLYYWNVFIHQKMKRSHPKAYDNHVFISGVDHSKIDQEQIKEKLKGFMIKTVIYTYKIDDYLKLLSKKNQLEVLKRKYEQQGRDEKVNKIKQYLLQIDHNIIQIKNQLAIGNSNALKTDKIFIQFEGVEDKIRFQNQYREGIVKMIYGVICKKSKFTINKCHLFVENLGEPRQMIWENMQVSSAKGYIIIFVNYVVISLMLGVSFFLVTLFTSKKQEYANTNGFLAFVFSIVITLINFILGFIIDFSTKLQGRYTITGLFFAKLLKKTIVYFVNTTIIPFSMFLFENFRPQEGSFIQNILTLFIMGNIVSPIVGQYFNIAYFVKLYKQHLIKKAGSNCIQTQIYANKIFEKMDFNLEDRYSTFCQRMANCMFYAAIFPVGAAIAMVGLIITFYIAKYELVRNCSIPKLSFRLGKLVNNLVAFFPCIYSFGYVANLYIYQQNPTYNTTYTIILAALTVPISLTFVFLGNRVPKKFVIKQLDKNMMCGMIRNEQASYKDLNPAAFLFQQAGSSQINPQNAIFNNIVNSQFFLQNADSSKIIRRLSTKDGD